VNFGRLVEMWKNLEPRGQVGLIGGAIAVLGTMFLLYTFSSRPSYVTIESNLTSADSSAAAKALGDAGIGYKLADGGATIQVQDSKANSARVALASSNAIGGGQVGFEIFDKKSLGATDFQNKVDYQRALEGQIGRTIQQIQGVQSATVNLVLPEETLFADQNSAATASVLIQSSQLDPNTVAGIAHLVASSVKGLSAQKVTITDSTGALLWPTGSGGSAGTDAGVKLQTEQQYSSQVAAKINTFLASTLGVGKAQAQVHADLDVDQTTIDKTTYAKKGTPLQTQVADETLQNKGGGTANLASGSASNIPTYTAGAAASGAGANSNYSNKTGSTVYGVDKTVEHTNVVPGAVNKLDVALVFDKTVPAAQVASLQKTVASLAGIVPARGDTLAVSTVQMAAQPKATAGPATGPLANPMGLAKYVLLGLGALLFLFFMRRNLKRREGEDLGGQPTWLREIEAAVPLAELEAGNGDRALLAAAGERRAQDAAQLEEIVRAQPQRIAAQVGQWMKE
jgi:flagellar M-ring protein FliF